MPVFKGNTSGGQAIAKAQAADDAPFLPAGFFRKDTELFFVVLSFHKSSNGPYVGAKLLKPKSVTIDNREHELVRIGNLAGITLARLEALKDAKQKHFVVGDKVWLKCTGITPPEKPGHSASPNFAIEIDREEAQPEQAEPAKESAS